MKDSGIAWIGEIPKEWKTINLKYLVECLDGKRIPIDSSLRQSGDIPYWGAGNIVDYVNDYIFDEELVLLGEDGAPFFDPYRPVAFYSKEKIWVNNHIHVLRMLPNQVNAKFTMYALNMVDYKSYITGSILAKLTQQAMKIIRLPIPSLFEQQRIATFLDKKCKEIDALIALQEEMITELQAYKQSVISETVTKGLNPKVTMKDSGVEWIGEIPEHWEVCRLKNYFNIGSGTTPQSENSDYWGDKYNWITPADFKTEDIYVETGKRALSELGFKSYSLTIYPAQSIVFSKRAPIGQVVINNKDVCINQGCFGCIPYQRTCIKFFYYTLSIYKEQFELFGSGTTFKEISAFAFKNFRIACPNSSTEQQAIADYLDTQCTRIDSLIALKQAKIESLKEYKKSVIYEYVTGKKEVPATV